MPSLDLAHNFTRAWLQERSTPDCNISMELVSELTLARPPKLCGVLATLFEMWY